MKMRHDFRQKGIMVEPVLPQGYSIFHNQGICQAILMIHSRILDNNIW